jgi:HEAT repeat protein
MGGGLSFTGGEAGAADDSAWSLWWQFNKEPYLELRAHVRSAPISDTGDGLLLGRGDGARKSLKPTQAQIRASIVPVLLAALARETNNDIVTACLIALAKIGEAGEGAGNPPFAPVFERFLADRNQEISETAAVALGIMASPRSIEALAALLLDSDDGRALVGRSSVHRRTRAFAGYGLGLIGVSNPDAAIGERIVVILKHALETDDTASADLKVACVNAIGLVPLPGLVRLAQIDALLGLLQDEELDPLVRAHCPAALGRLVPGLSADRREPHRRRTVDVLIRLATARSQRAELVHSSVQALGLLGTNDGEDPLDGRIRDVLTGSFRDQQAQRFALVALAKVGARAGAARPEDGVREAASFLLDRLSRERSDIRAWAGLSCGILARGLVDAGTTSPVIGSLQQAVRVTLRDERDPSSRGALAISCGIMGAREAAPLLLELLNEERGDDARGHFAVALGLMGAREALGPVNKIVGESRYRPELLQHAAIALALLGDAGAVPKLTGLLAEARSLATQASLSTALGFVGDQRSVDPLVAMLGNRELTERARAFAAVALGIVADEDLLPWNTKIALDGDYRAAPATLTDPGTGAGVLDIL